MTDLVHSRAEREAASAAADALFGRSDLADLSEATLQAVVDELGGVQLTNGDAWGEGALPSVLEVLEKTGVVPSRSAGRRAVEQGGAYINNVKVTDPNAVLTPEQLLHGRWVVARRGKKTVGALII